jgi:glycosyltransferase involved in cell wall biosynthesis
MKIAFILPSLANKGPIVFTKYLIEGLKSKVDYIEVFYFKDIVELDLGVPTKQISFFEKNDFDNFDIVHTTMIKADLYSWWNKKRIGNKAVVSMHNYLVEDLNFLYKPFKAKVFTILWKMSLNSINHIIVSSEDQLNYYKKLLGNQKDFTLIPYGINQKELKELDNNERKLLENLKNKYTILGSCGLLIERKGFKQLIEFLKNNSNFAVVLIGEGEDRINLESLIEKYSLQDRFILLGFKDNSIDYYRYFDIYVMTSYSEGFGLAMLEAMSQSLPIVCSNLPLYKGYFDDTNVALFEPKNIESLSNAIYKVVKEIKYYKQASYKLFEERFSLDVMGDRHIKLYERVISEASKTRK